MPAVEAAAAPHGGRGRFAPSPTGDLHLGNARTALLAWARARRAGASFVMRVEDIDGPRTVPGALQGTLDELRWLGVDWDEGPDVGGPAGPYRQSQRSERYQAALERLAQAGQTFACYLSRSDLREVASAPHGATGPVYGAAERAHNAVLAQQRAAAGRPASVRFEPVPSTLTLDDALHGQVRFDTERDVGAVVLRRSDGLWSYALAVVVDDAAMGIEEVVRGDDLLAASGPQLALQVALGLRTPRYLHVPVLLDASGERMAKRRGDWTLRALRERGTDPARLRGALLASAGLLPAPEPLSVSDTLRVADALLLRRDPSVWSAELDAFVAGG